MYQYISTPFFIKIIINNPCHLTTRYLQKSSADAQKQTHKAVPSQIPKPLPAMQWKTYYIENLSKDTNK
jgi:hypothetical protein